MKPAEIREQIRQHELVVKANDTTIKALQKENGVRNGIVKALKSLLPKDQEVEEEFNTADGLTSEESH